MKIAAISPIPHLSDLAMHNRSNYHLILSHLVHKSLEYREFYNKLHVDHFVILDNSAHETTIGQTSDLLHSAWQMTLADEIVLPDRLFFGEDTVETSTETYKFLEERLPKGVQYMAVPQGRTWREWMDCLDGLLAIKGVGSIGISKDYEPWDGGIPALVERVLEKIDHGRGGHQIHLLGWGRDALQLRGISHYSDVIRGIDSAKPIVYAEAGVSLPAIGNTGAWTKMKYPRRQSNFFDACLSDDAVSLSKSNIDLFGDFIHTDI